MGPGGHRRIPGAEKPVKSEECLDLDSMRMGAISRWMIFSGRIETYILEIIHLIFFNLCIFRKLFRPRIHKTKNSSKIWCANNTIHYYWRK
jgi:hypothetical protein